MLEVHTIKAFEDNYHWLLVDPRTRQAAVVDPGDASPVLAHLTAHNLTLVAILITHHHGDHIGGVGTLLTHLGPLDIYGPDTPRIPHVNHVVNEGDSPAILGVKFDVLSVPGHTLEHIAYASQTHLVAGRALFCGDTLFAAGCGRMFEGTPPMMQASLQKLSDLPSDTLVYCAHEYTLSNLRFAAAVMPHNENVKARQRDAIAKRERGEATVPSVMTLEHATNPFLRCTEPEVIVAVQNVEPSIQRDPASVFGALRRWKDKF